MHKNGKFECLKCQIKFTFNGLRTHNRRFHTKAEQSDPCPICKVRLSSSAQLGNFSIKMCNTGSGVISNFIAISEAHMQVHIIGDVRCEVCQIRFTPNSLIHHRKAFHPDFRVPASVIAKRKVRQYDNSSIPCLRFIFSPCFQGLFQKQSRERKRLQKITYLLKFQCKLCKIFCGDVKKLGKFSNWIISHAHGHLIYTCVHRDSSECSYWCGCRVPNM